MALFIWAIDANGGAASWAAWIKTAAISAPWATFETVWVYSVPDMVNKVIAAAGNDKISRLVLYGHAGSGYQAVGCGHLTTLNRTCHGWFHALRLMPACQWAAVRLRRRPMEKPS